VGDVDRHAHVGEMEAVAQPNEGERDDMMQHQLPKVLPRFLELQHQHQALLRPVRALQEVVRLEHALVRAMREPSVHACGIEVPDRGPTHHVQPKRPKNGKIHGGIELFHKPSHLIASTDASADTDRTDEALHQELAAEAEHDDVEGDEGEVLGSLAILRDVPDVGGQGVGAFDEGRVGVGEEDGGVQRVVLAGGDEVEGEHGEGEEERGQPGVLEAGALEAGEGVLCFSALAAALFAAEGLWWVGHWDGQIRRCQCVPACVAPWVGSQTRALPPSSCYRPLRLSRIRLAAHVRHRDGWKWFGGHDR